MHFASTKAPRGYHEAEYRDGDFLVFGCETRGLPENLLEKVGGPAFIAGLANAVPSASNVTYYANIVREKADLRNLINAASDITAMAFDGEEDVPTILDKAEKRIMDASSRHMSGDFTPINQIVIESIDKINTVYESRGGLTGIPSLPRACSPRI